MAVSCRSTRRPARARGCAPTSPSRKRYSGGARPQRGRAWVQTLERAGYKVLAASDGLEALEILRTAEPIHLVFTDVVMGRLRGPGLHQLSRQEGRTMPFLFTSGYASGRDAEPLDPSLPFLPKPWTSADLLARVRQVLDAATR